MMHTVRPPTRPTPVTTPSAGVSGSWLRAKRKSSWKSDPGSSKSRRRSRTKSFPSSLSLARYLTCPCSMRARTSRYRSSLTGPSGNAARQRPGGIRVRPQDDDEHPPAIGGAREDSRRAGRGAQAGNHFRLLTLQEPHVHAHPVSAELLRGHGERTVAGYGKALDDAEWPFEDVSRTGVKSLKRKMASSWGSNRLYHPSGSRPGVGTPPAARLLAIGGAPTGAPSGDAPPGGGGAGCAF